MPLIDLKTDLKSLKYGHDRPGGGNSGQPYETVNINAIDQGLQSPLFRNGDDGLIRGGFDGAFKSSVIDLRRINKFFKDKPKGPLFITRQIGLQLSNPQLEVKKKPDLFGILTGDLSSIPVIGGTLQPTRLYNLGKNTLAQIPVNAFGGHLNRHGLVPIQDDNTKYLAVAQFNNQGSGKDNRLVTLKNKFKLGDGRGESIGTGSRFLDRLLGFVKQVLPIKFEPKNLTIYNYVGGPNSVYGLGNTLIKRYDNTESKNSNKQLPQERGIVDRTYTLGVSNQYPLPSNFIAGVEFSQLPDKNPTVINYKQNIPAGANGTSNSPTLRKYQELKKQVDGTATETIFKYNNNKLVSLGRGNNDTYTGVINNYTNNPVIYKNGVDPVIRIKGTWNTLNRETRVGSGYSDEINLTPLFSAEAGTIGDRINIPGSGRSITNINDLCKFRIQALNGNDPTQATWMIFRAYLTQFTDNVDATWSDTKYVGRGESFYIYSGFIRKINIGFKVAALSAEEMKPMYQKLNYLMSNLMPDYEGILMRGPLVRMTVGNWIDGQTGILNSLNYTVPQDSPWEIGLIVNEDTEPLILPHIVEVNMTFTPIGSQTKTNNLISQKSPGVSNIAQNINEDQYIDGIVENGTDVNKIKAVPLGNIPPLLKPFGVEGARVNVEAAQRRTPLARPNNLPGARSPRRLINNINFSQADEDLNFNFLAENAG